MVVNAQHVARCIEALDEDSGTGPDGFGEPRAQEVRAPAVSTVG